MKAEEAWTSKGPDLKKYCQKCRQTAVQMEKNADNQTTI